MDRPSVVETLDPQLAALFALRRGETRLGLASTRRLLHLAGDPARDIPVVHIAGTNGKGSTTALAAAMLQAGGLRVGRFTSPHVLRVEERICVDGMPIDRDTLRRRIRDLWPLIERTGASFFEAMTVLAALHFRAEKCDVAVYEVGLGGRLDSTNVLPASVSVLTSVGNDHEAILGRGLQNVCREKLGIAKRGVAFFAALERRDLVRLAVVTCARRRAPLTLLPQDCGRVLSMGLESGMQFELRFPVPARMTSRLYGAHQVRNTALAAAAVRELFRRGVIDRPPDLVQGAARAFMPGRFQVFMPYKREPAMVLDVGHNPQAIAATLDVAAQLVPGVRPRVVLGLLRDKHLGATAARLASFARDIVLTAPAMDRSWDARAARREFPAGRHDATVRVEPRVADALAWALDSAPQGTPVFVLGSHYLLGEAVPLLAARRGVAPDVLLYGAHDEPLRAAV
jgi:dihydrofolate synthase/folylpolyglutamate synthase